VTVAASRPPVHEPAASLPAGDAFGRFTLAGKPLLALTQDSQLLATLQKVTDPAHEVSAAGSEIDFSAALLAHHAGVAVLDSAAIATPIAQLTQRLSTQFPELVLIVAGGIDEQAMLAAQIADGSVHRFLHKPVSEQRVRLFVEAAWRRHAEGRTVPAAAAAPVPAPKARRSGRWWEAGLALAVIATPFIWIGTHPPQSTPRSAPSSPAAGGAASSDAQLESLLARADAALLAGELTAPAGASAADLYRAALRRNARDPRAVNGLEQVIGRLLAAAEAHLQHAQLDGAQTLAEQARAIDPNHPRVAFLLAQIGAQREHAVLDKAQRAAAGGNVAGALAVLDAAARGARRSTLVNEARAQLAQQQLAQQQLDARVTDYLSRGRDAGSRGALIAPLEDNARFYIESARALAPNDARVQEATADLIARLESEARQALAAKNPDAAESWTAAAADAGAAAAEVAILRQQLQQLRAAVSAEALASLALAFNERLAQGRIDEPPTDSAQFYLAQLLQADPAHPAAQTARAAYDARVLDEARGALGRQDFPSARHWLAAARSAHADAAAVGTLETSVTAAEAEVQLANAYVNESTLTRTRYVAPQFPEEARLRGIEGWVELHFVVDTDGTVGELAVVGAQPVGIFEQAALDAVRRWHYRPLVRGGEPVSQRARVRLRFTVQR
jgi:TonB family protein